MIMQTSIGRYDLSPQPLPPPSEANGMTACITRASAPWGAAARLTIALDAALPTDACQTVKPEDGAERPATSLHASVDGYFCTSLPPVCCRLAQMHPHNADKLSRRCCCSPFLWPLLPASPGTTTRGMPKNTLTEAARAVDQSS